MEALTEVHKFLHAAVTGLCDKPKKVKIEISLMSHTITGVIRCSNSDLRYVYPKMVSLKEIAKGISLKYNYYISLVLDDGDGSYIEV